MFRARQKQRFLKQQFRNRNDDGMWCTVHGLTLNQYWPLKPTDGFDSCHPNSNYLKMSNLHELLILFYLLFVYHICKIIFLQY